MFLTSNAFDVKIVDVIIFWRRTFSTSNIFDTTHFWRQNSFDARKCWRQKFRRHVSWCVYLVRESGQKSLYGVTKDCAIFFRRQKNSRRKFLTSEDFDVKCFWRQNCWRHKFLTSDVFDVKHFRRHKILPSRFQKLICAFRQTCFSQGVPFRKRGPQYNVGDGFGLTWPPPTPVLYNII